ncbi:MAG TPA: FxsA family protein, partial [Epsilonproteobacteria bacterium]|nr:FxsA family protein [Campylobacterota bacterium]
MIVLLIPFLFLELYLSLKVGEEIGFLGSVIWIMLSFFVGMTLLQRSSYTMMGNMNAMRQGKLDMKK